MPTLHRGGGHAQDASHGADAAELLKNALHETLRDELDVRFTHHNRTSNVRQSHSRAIVEFRTIGTMRPSDIVDELKRLEVPHEEIASTIGRDRTAATKMLNGRRSIKTQEIAPLTELVERYRGVKARYAPAEAASASVAAPMKDIHRRIPVVGDVEAGAWRETVAREAYEIEEFLSLDVTGYESASLRAMRVVGPSMNKLYPPGRFVIIAPAAEAGVRAGDHVVIERQLGSMTEITLKEYVEEPGGRIAFWPRSDHPDFQQPIYLKASNDHDQDGVKIIGVVVADYRRRDRPN